MALKVLGSIDGVINQIASFTRGLGYALIPIDGGSTTGGGIGIATDVVLSAASFVTQDPIGTDNPIQVTFGSAVTTPDVEIDVNGNLKFNVIDDWAVTYRVNIGRVTSPGVAYLFIRTALNGVGSTSSVEADLDDGGFSIPLEFQFSFRSAVNDILTAEMYRDSAGANNGGLRSRPAALAGWTASPSAKVIVRRSVVNTEPNPPATTFIGI